MAGEKRKKFWIDPSLQTYMVCFVLLLLASSLFVVYLSIDSKIEEAGRLSGSIIISVDSVRHLIREPLYLSGGIALIASAILTLLASHRVIGPLMVLTAGLRRVRDGDLTMDVQVRDTDSITGTVRDFARMQAALRETVLEDRKHLQRIDDKLERIASHLQSNHKAAEDLGHVRKEIKKVTSFFHL